MDLFLAGSTKLTLWSVRNGSTSCNGRRGPATTSASVAQLGERSTEDAEVGISIIPGGKHPATVRLAGHACCGWVRIAVAFAFQATSPQLHLVRRAIRIRSEVNGALLLEAAALS